MIKTNNAAWLQPAIDLLARTAPGKLQDMNAADWPVHVITTVVDLDETYASLVRDDGLPTAEAYGAVRELAGNLDNAFGVTATPNDSGLRLVATTGHTWLNAAALKIGAVEVHAKTPEAMVADTMIHEWAHVGGADERAAYAAGTAYAELIGEHEMAALSERTSRNVQLDGLLGLIKGVFGNSCLRLPDMVLTWKRSLSA